MNHWEQN